jgi:hypothetical protein
MKLKTKFSTSIVIFKNRILTNSNEFREGIRAALIDKDKKPQWKYATIRDFDEKDIIQAYFGDINNTIQEI